MKYRARLIDSGRVLQQIEFEADSDATAWREANDQVDPITGHWVEVQRIHPRRNTEQEAA